MANEMNRRQMLGTTTALLGGAIAGVAGDAFAGQEKPTATAPGAAAGGPNLSPPIVEIKGGKLRGLREGKTFSFLGVRYAEAERFGAPKPVQSWTGIKNAQVWGAVCPSPEQTTVGSDELVFPHRYFIAQRELPVSERLDAEPDPGDEEAGHGVDARRRLHQRLVDGVVRL